MTVHDEILSSATAALFEGRLDDPFALLGPHASEGGTLVRTFQPGAEKVELVTRKKASSRGTLEEVGPGLFVGKLPKKGDYALRITWPGGTQQVTEDPYSFGTVLSDYDLHLFSEGRHLELAKVFGAQPTEMDGVAGVAFSVWAPNARRVSVVGEFNTWDGRRHPMRLRHSAGVWELFVPRLGAGELYKFEIAGHDGSVIQKADPIARATEVPPGTASIVAPKPDFAWSDEDWMKKRAARQASDAPISVYEVHAGSWKADEGGEPLDWRGMADKLVSYVVSMGFTHVELLPIMEHPFGGSWGYQPLSQFAPSARFGDPSDFAYFVDACHQANIGVILDWVPAHFPSDAHGLAHFDGTHLYEHADPKEGFHQDWNTLIYNLGRQEVSGFLLASAIWWLEAFHIDGLRVDAVASMLYRDYSREAGEWVPNVHGGRENLESVAFLKAMNEAVAERCPGAITVAEESTAWPGVTAPVADGGLGFDYKWNMGWMHDTLQYIEHDPVHRKWHHGELTFPMVYAYSEKYVLPISHDEVVHGKGSLWAKMPGDRWRKFANLRAYLAFMWTHPGKKLLFMGCELGMESEWNHDTPLPWHLLEQDEHAAVQRLLRDLNRLYADERPLHARDCNPGGFKWIVGDDAQNSVFSFVRWDETGEPIVAAFNMTPTPLHDYRMGLPRAGKWREVLNTDAQDYGGSNMGNSGILEAQEEGMHDQPASAALTLPPLGALVLSPASD
ncbi:1,4-alpha-glucan branching protein GlgB [Qipengyuania atrilutea]|uniref:1,4-alpha-glucan branching enzyme GlgB n=1 Tax=Qipengyuania atrilutea TaxID=2744473 RepID=A0A850GYN4_9SPHN|nr:1,4-alpha-glucan branching protein GlgB [Actirhodobacter atriluteus]NVD44754.1 1,4-alpha-glucan branching protein GlgB [Actirhodobacter atriluteus]